MTINELIEQGITFQGMRKVSGWKGGLEGGEEVFYEDSDEWSFGTLDEEECPWAEYEIIYMYANDSHKGGCLVIELDIPED